MPWGSNHSKTAHSATPSETTVSFLDPLTAFNISSTQIIPDTITSEHVSNSITGQPMPTAVGVMHRKGRNSYSSAASRPRALEIFGLPFLLVDLVKGQSTALEARTMGQGSVRRRESTITVVTIPGTEPIATGQVLKAASGTKPQPPRIFAGPALLAKTVKAYVLPENRYTSQGAAIKATVNPDDCGATFCSAASRSNNPFRYPVLVCMKVLGIFGDANARHLHQHSSLHKEKRSYNSTSGQGQSSSSSAIANTLTVPLPSSTAITGAAWNSTTQHLTPRKAGANQCIESYVFKRSDIYRNNVMEKLEWPSWPSSAARTRSVPWSLVFRMLMLPFKVVGSSVPDLQASASMATAFREASTEPCSTTSIRTEEKTNSVQGFGVGSALFDVWKRASRLVSSQAGR
jgi:hypothetical protein